MKYRINEAEYQATLTKIQLINARAIKRGFTGRITLEAKEVTVADIDTFGLEHVEVYYDVVLGGEAPSYQGWTFIASLDWDPEAGLIVKTAPGIVSVNRGYLVEGWCDHCRKARRRRKAFLVRNDATGQEVQVGSTCIKDFLGWDGSIVFINEASVAEDLGFGGFGSAPDRWGTDYVLSLAWALVKLYGYKPASGFERTTKHDVVAVLQPPVHMPPGQRAELERVRDLASEAKQRAAECRTWVLSEDFQGDNEYVRNLKQIAAADHVSLGNVGILVSAPQAWARWQERTLIREASTSEWVGTVKERITITVTIASIRYIKSQWGTTVLYSLKDDRGNIFKWFASREALGDATGKRLTLKATVKKHTEFNGTRQTELTRGHIVAWLD